jgi:hypothetical protein
VSQLGGLWESLCPESVIPQGVLAANKLGQIRYTDVRAQIVADARYIPAGRFPRDRYAPEATVGITWSSHPLGDLKRARRG